MKPKTRPNMAGAALAVLVALCLLVGCDQTAKKQPDDAKPEAGTWAIIPAASSSSENTSIGLPIYSVWRLNTKTGALEFCDHNPGGMVVKGTVTLESLTCTAPVLPPVP